jgi:hypothetical protein
MIDIYLEDNSNLMKSLIKQAKIYFNIYDIKVTDIKCALPDYLLRNVNHLYNFEKLFADDLIQVVCGYENRIIFITLIGTIGL